MIKANKYYKNFKSLELHDLSIPTNKCTKISVQHPVDIRHILLVITWFAEYNMEYTNESDKYRYPKNLSRSQIEQRLRNLFKEQGERPFEYVIFEKCEHETFSHWEEQLPGAIYLAKKLFPEFCGDWITPSMKYLKKIKRKK